MTIPQSHPTPKSGQRPRFKDVPWILSYSVRGLVALIKARLAFAKFDVKEIPERNARSKAIGISGCLASPEVIARISYVIPRLSDRLPWRSDCLIQAIAAQNWLNSRKATSEIQIGVEHPKDGQFAAHAWLVYEGVIVTGGDVEQYEVILSDSRPDGKTVSVRGGGSEE